MITDQTPRDGGGTNEQYRYRYSVDHIIRNGGYCISPVTNVGRVKSCKGSISPKRGKNDRRSRAEGSRRPERGEYDGERVYFSR